MVIFNRKSGTEAGRPRYPTSRQGGKCRESNYKLRISRIETRRKTLRVSADIPFEWPNFILLSFPIDSSEEEEENRMNSSLCVRKQKRHVIISGRIIFINPLLSASYNFSTISSCETNHVRTFQQKHFHYREKLLSPKDKT